jgi:Zn-dependent peptidase ImmA (M78 family)
MKKITLEILKNTAEILGIKIVYAKLPPGLLGKANAETKIISLNVSLRDNPVQEKCVLAHEIGHVLYPPRPGHIRYYSRNFLDLNFYERSNIKAIVDQDERKALDWATRVLMPDGEFNRIAEEGNYSLKEIADFFDVEPWLVEHKVGYYRRKQRDAGKKIRWRDIIRRDQTLWAPEKRGF